MLNEKYMLLGCSTSASWWCSTFSLSKEKRELYCILIYYIEKWYLGIYFSY
jgi:hypothetical protein